MKRIAEASGVSRQRVQQIIKRHEAKHGPLRFELKVKPRNRARAITHCVACGRVKERKLSHQHAKFCSIECVNADIKVMSDAVAVDVIRGRETGLTWKEVSEDIGVTVQAVQKYLYRYLHSQGDLHVDRLNALWAPADYPNAKAGSWKWLANSTGLRPAGVC